MNSLKSVIIVILILTAMWSYNMILDYDRLDAFNQASGAFQWVSSLGDDVYHVRILGDDRQYCIAASTDQGEGVIDKRGKEILPCEYNAVGYHGGEYIAAATTSDYKLFDLRGKESASFNRIRFPYAYAGDRYFIQYGDDHILHWQDGFQILDAVSGETVAAYDDCYNAVRLDDGNWYISRTPDVDGAAMRWVLLEPYGPLTGGPQGGDAKPPEGFFVDENFGEMFYGKAYRLICQGDGLYVASVVEKGDTARPSIVVLDETGERFQVKDEAALKRINTYEKNGDLVNDTTTIFKGEDGSIGLAPLDQTDAVIYLNESGSQREEPQNNGEAIPGYAVNAQYGVNKGLTLYRKISTEDGYEQTLYGIKGSSGRTLIPPLFEEILFLPHTENLLVNGELGCGIIRLEVDQ